MNQALLTRLFKSMEGNPDTPLIKVAYSIIEEEKRKGHTRLAEKLSSILKERIEKGSQYQPSFKVAKEKNYKTPVDRRYRLPFVRYLKKSLL